MITLYDCSTAPSPRRARILLAEKGVAHDTVQVDLRNGEQLGEAYRQINPQCTVPALRTQEGLLLTDNAAIAAYLEARYPSPPLLGETPEEKAEIASWNWRMEFEGLQAIAEALRLKWELGLAGGAVVTNPIPTQFAMPKADIDAAIAQALQEADEQGVKGKASTPFLLARVCELTGGNSLAANIQLVLNNAALGAKIAASL